MAQEGLPMGTMPTKDGALPGDQTVEPHLILKMEAGRIIEIADAESIPGWAIGIVDAARLERLPLGPERRG